MTSISNGRPWRSAFVAAALVTWLAATAAVAGCATGTNSGFGGGGTSSSTSTSGGGNTGGGRTGGGGAGGTTSTSPCAVDCSQIQTPTCQVAQCNEQTGQCEVVADTDGTACEDGLFCTVDDACVSSICEPGPDNDCGLSPAACEVVSCDEGSQTCTTIASQNGDPCIDPNNLCLENATCTSGLCQGTPKDCFFAPVPDDCHVSECNPQNGQCEPVIGNEAGPCTDLNELCAVNKTCAAGVCQGGNPKDCSYLTQDCVLGVCDVNNGQCGTQQLNNGDPCDDLDPCTNGEICQSGQCTGGTPVTACVANDGCCPNNCTPQNDLDCAVTLLFDSYSGGSSATTRAAGNACGTQLTVGPNPVTVTKIAVRNDLTPSSGNYKFLIFNHSSSDLNVYTSAPQSFTDNGMSWKESATFNYVLQPNTSYCIGAITDAAASWQYDTTTDSQNGMTSVSSNPNWTGYANPVVGGHAGADCSIQLYGHP